MARSDRSSDGTRVAMVILDAMPDRHLDPVRTPNLWHQARAGGRAPGGGVSVPVSVTYANHAAFVTGADPAATGVHGNHTWIEEQGWVLSPDAGPRAVTLFDRVAELTVDPDARFADLRALYESDPRLRMDGTVFSVLRGRPEHV